jgi:hypothetical protein
VVFRYITHRLFGGPDRSGGHSFARDAYFVPAGWDSPAKVALLTEGPVGADGRRLGGGGYPEDTAYGDVVPPPDTDKVRVSVRRGLGVRSQTPRESVRRSGSPTIAVPRRAAVRCWSHH